MQLGEIGRVAGQVAVQLPVPEIHVGSRPTLPFAAIVTVPETALHQHGGLVMAQHQIGRAGQLADVEPVAKTSSPYGMADKPLRRRQVL